ncbi:MAG: 30S ribosomal protein S9 [Candidatus Woesearchaeota archaeon]
MNVSGKRKSAIARVTYKKGSGKLRINSLPLERFAQPMYALRISEPLLIAESVAKKLDISVSVSGGGMAGQADAIRLALGKALVEASGKAEVEQALEEYDRTLLVADVRRKEKRKPNTAGKARSKTQKSYR